MSNNLEREDRVNWSTLKYMGQSPKHYLHHLSVSREDTPALLLGRLVHAMVYEPETVEERYVVMPKFHGGMKDDTAIAKGFAGGKESKVAWLAAAGAADVVPEEVFSTAAGMAGALHRDPVAGEMVVGGRAEQLIEWTDTATGILCRGRVDHVGRRLSDLKTTRNIAPRAFRRDIVRYEYYGQIAYYLDGLEANQVTMPAPPCIVAVENVAPFDVIVLQFTDADIAAGRALYRRYLDLLAECRNNGKWAGSAGGRVLAVELPEWVSPTPELTLGGLPLGV